MIDFDKIVLAPCQAIFAKPATIVPLASQPSVPPYIARGIWTVRSIDVPMEDGSMMSSQTNRLSVRDSEFSVFVKQGDQVILDQSVEQLGSTIGGTVYIIDDADADGQGGTDLILKALSA